jgi:probable F420-dependent oxidoreductase
MRFNYQFPLKAVQRWESWSEGHQLAELAVAAEEAGFDSVSSTDHPSPDAGWLRQGGHQDFELFTALAFMAARTSRIRLLTFVMIAGYRSPYLAARAAATLDYMSEGRLTLGMGAGYLKQEFEVLGASFADRGKRFDAAIGAMRQAWAGEVAEYDDPYFPAHGTVMSPKPIQQPAIPIWIGGNSGAARRRVAELADGWLPFEQLPETAAVTRTPALTSLDELAQAVQDVREARTAAGRDPAFEVCFSPLGAKDVESHVEHLAQRLGDYEQAGVSWLSYDARARSWGAAVREIELAGQVLVRKR